MGPPGSGKSDLALRLIDRGAKLVADDRVVAEVVGEALLLSPPQQLAGLIEVRGVGILPMDHVADVAARLVVEFADQPPRLPDPAWREVAGHRLPLLLLAPFEVSAAHKVELAVAHVGDQR